VSILKSAFLIIGILSIAGCASIMHGSRQNISVASQPSGAVVRVNNIVATTPGVVNLSRSTPMYILRFEKEGYESVEVKLIRTKDGWLWGNILLGGLIGLAIDYSSGSAYKLTPDKIEVALNKLDKLSLNKKNGDLLVFVDRN
jgi:hypothetical protein